MKHGDLPRQAWDKSEETGKKESNCPNILCV
jgi:hypothetical protein